MRSVSIDKFIVLLGGILVLIAVMLIFTFRGVFHAIAIAYDIGKVDTESELRINTPKLEEAKNYALGQKTIIPLNIKSPTTPIISISPKPSPVR